jgi:hypothetical protein
MLRARGGAMQEDSGRQLLVLSRWVALASILLTSICTAAVLGLQFSSVVASKGWTFLSVREILEGGAQPDQQDVTAGIGYNASPILEWVLDLPAMLLLGSVLGLLVMYYRYLKSLDNTSPGA